MSGTFKSQAGLIGDKQLSQDAFNIVHIGTKNPVTVICPL